MKKAKDPFSIDIVLRHLACSPESISKALSLKPSFSHAVGDKSGGSRARWATFYSRLQKGDSVSEFEVALTSVASFLERNEAFWTDFVGGGGEVELTLNHTIDPGEEGDKCFELYLAPAFLHDLSARGIGLKVQGWTRNATTTDRREKKANRTTKPR
jgi:hypothetical protein